jgi:hypothetical protein
MSVKPEDIEELISELHHARRYVDKPDYRLELDRCIVTAISMKARIAELDAALEAEREECASTAEAVSGNDYLVSDGEAGRMGFRAGCKETAAAIRDRSAFKGSDG